jgi:hypothetical protein
MDFSRFKPDITSFKQPIEKWDSNVFVPDDALWTNNLGVLEYWGGGAFSGTLVNDYSRSVHLTEYENGIQHGKHGEFWVLGHCSKLEVFEHGRLLMRQDWYNNELIGRSAEAEPQLALHITREGAKGWYQDGTLEYEAKDADLDCFDAFKVHHYYFPSGSPKMTEQRIYPPNFYWSYSKADKTYFFHDGTEAFRHITQEVSEKKSEYKFNHDNILNRLQDVIESPIEDSGYAFRHARNVMLYGKNQDRANFFALWLEALRSERPQNVEDVLHTIGNASNHELSEALNIL